MKTMALILGLALLGASCSNTRYKNAQDEETINAEFGSTDKQRFVEGVTSDLLASPALSHYKQPDERGDARQRQGLLRPRGGGHVLQRRPGLEQGQQIGG